MTATRWQAILWLVLLSGAGLATLVAKNLADAAESARAQARYAASGRLRDQAQALRLWLRTPDHLDLMPAAACFAVQSGRLVVPEAVGWLTAHQAVPVDFGLDEGLRQAQVAEFVDRDPERTAAIYAELLAEREPTRDRLATLRLHLAAGWFCHRSNQPERVLQELRPVQTALDNLPPADLAQAPFAELCASALLLAFAAEHSLPAWAISLGPALPDELADATFARLAEYGAAALAANLQQESSRRRLARITLLQARDLMPTLAPGTLVAPIHGERVLIWHGERVAAATGSPSGRGALLAPEQLVQVLTTALPDLLPLHTHEPQDATPPAEEVLPGRLWLAAEPPAPAGLLHPPLLLAAGALALLLTLGGSVLFGARAMRRELAAMRARSDFLTGVTHELKTPVASIRLIAEVLSDDPVEPARQREYFALLTGETARLSMLIENVLDLGQIERGERNYEFLPVDLGELLQRTLAVFAPLAECAGIKLHSQLPDVPLPAQADATAIAQALLALLENARKYAACGHRIEVHAQRADSHLLVGVRDFGPGVPPAECEAIFARFGRGSLHRHGSVPGIGLGLYLARRIAERHGGSLRCRAPSSGLGALFELTLPLTEGPP